MRASNYDSCSYKLSKYFKEVIKLSQDLIDAEKISNEVYNKGVVKKSESNNKEEESNPFINNVPIAGRSWRIGDVCLAPWSSDNCSRQGRIVAMDSSRGFCTIYFESYDHTETVDIKTIRHTPILQQPSTASKARNKAEFEKMKQKKHKKSLNKKQKWKEMEAAHEEVKSKWTTFFNETSSKNKLKGIVKKSIFSTTDSSNAKVGIGTCGISGKPMTKYQTPQHPAHRK